MHLKCMCLLSLCLAATESVADDAAVTVTVPPSISYNPTGTDSDAEALDVAFWSAAADGDLEQLKFLLARGADVHPQNRAAPTSALWIASQEGHTQVVKLLLALGTNVEEKDPSDGRTALFQAAQEGHADIVELLLEHGARVDIRSTRTRATPLFVAAARGHLDVARLLLAAGADADVAASADGISDSPLSIARKRKHAGIVELLEQTRGNRAHQ